MMAMLVLWLKKLILLVLLATFLDLLLPSSAYSKYVKLAMGLIILLALLSPILDLFHKDISLTQLSFTAGEAGKGAPDFARIEALAKRLAADNDEQANRYVEQQIGALIKKQIEAQHGVKVETVDVHVHPDGQKAKQPIERISIIVALDKPRETGTQEQGLGIEPMKPVKIDISLGAKPNSSTNDKPVAATTEQSHMEKSITTTISNAWNVPESTVLVTWRNTGEEG